jgi:hypothetical protein
MQVSPGIAPGLTHVPPDPAGAKTSGRSASSWRSGRALRGIETHADLDAHHGQPRPVVASTRSHAAGNQPHSAMQGPTTGEAPTQRLTTTTHADDRMLPQRSGMYEHAPGGSEQREAVPRHLTGGCTTDRPRCLPPTAAIECPAHADEAVVRRLWPTVRWLPVAHRLHQRPLRSAAWTYVARAGIPHGLTDACWSASTDRNPHRGRMPGQRASVCPVS